MYSTYDAIEWGPKLMGNHGQELLLDAHTLLKILNQLQPACNTSTGESLFAQSPGQSPPGRPNCNLLVLRAILRTL